MLLELYPYANAAYLLDIQVYNSAQQFLDGCIYPSTLVFIVLMLGGLYYIGRINIVKKRSYLSLGEDLSLNCDQLLYGCIH